MIDRSSCRKLGSVWAIGQGIVAAIAPGQSAKLVRRAIGESFDNAAELEPKPGYLRQLRALGTGLFVAGVVGLLLEMRADDGSHAVDGNHTDDGSRDR
ncbi:hypothetical protein AArcSl_1794 [Halalkaliarchaeum desulfuricum]|uniref:Uncharacterized protein n=1 Tax=Halalkaliarchaeum desulfuricum TaxID=2055893 RepID=A0A343TJZ9_9EURY|nr:hypothetical protein [Halalkaliarchaeum desulfuricum]AUX09421.1 hypothetical protein AArcSl_1794 [Halalkaliarchaeum desulfuricum]